MYMYKMKLETYEKQNDRIRIQFNLTKEELVKSNKHLAEVEAAMNVLREQNEEFHKRIIMAENGLNSDPHS